MQKIQERNLLGTTGTLLEDDKEMREQIARDEREEAVEALIDDAVQICWAAAAPGTINAICEDQVRSVLRLAYDKWSQK